MLDSIKSAKEAGAVVAETCTSGCGNGTIIIQKSLQTSGTPNGTFGFSATGEDMNPASFNLTPGTGMGQETITFNNVATGTGGGSRTILETVFPDETGTGFEWNLDSVSCNTENSATIWNQAFDSGEDLVGITVDNLADNDTLTCIFTNDRLPIID
jgi:hypothetical protein